MARRVRENAMVIHLVQLYFALILSVLLSCVAAWIIARSYRGRMMQLIRAPHIAEPAVAVAKATDDPLPLPVSLAANNRARMRLTILLIVLSFLIAITSASIWHVLQFSDEPLLP